jgi:Spy/CpxP family protein refolding chaperone
MKLTRRSRLRTALPVALVLVLVLAGVAMARGNGQRAGMAECLDLSDEQVEQVEAIREDAQAAMSQLRDQLREARAEGDSDRCEQLSRQLAEVREQMRNLVRGVLTPEQVERMNDGCPCGDEVRARTMRTQMKDDGLRMGRHRGR